MKEAIEMIHLETARKLKTAGLDWRPKSDDCFAIPDRGMDEQRFVLNNMTIQHEILKGHPAITFNGATEWALDYIFQVEAIWLPRESQLRELVLKELAQQTDQPQFSLSKKPGGYLCTIQTGASSHSFEGDSASEAYAEAVLHLLIGENA